MLSDLRLIQFLFCSTAVDGLAAGAILFSVRMRIGANGPVKTITFARMISALFGAACVFAVKLPFFQMQGMDVFGLLHLIYVDLTIMLPGLALGLLLWRKKSSLPGRTLTRPARIAAWLAFVAVPIGIYASWIEPQRLQLECARIDVSPKRAGNSLFRVGVLSDIQIGRVTDYERSAVDRLMAQRPDLILMPGDVFQGSAEQFNEEEGNLRELFSRLDAPGGVYLVLGDVDWNGDVMHRILRGTRIRMLNNEISRLSLGDRRITLGGVELNYGSEDAQGIVHTLETLSGEDDIRILLAHRPDVALGISRNSRIDAVIAGHTHGGQVVVPFFGPPMTLTNVPRDVAAGGLHRINENAIYVSRGVGCERGQAPRIRFLCPPEISVVTVGQGLENR